MEQVLADTSAWIASFSKSGHDPLKAIMKEKILTGELVLTGMVQLELLQGTRNDKEYESLQQKLAVLPFISADDSIWAKIARLSLLLRSKGVQTSTPDLFIAQIAVDNNLTLIHCDRDFERIAKHTSLRTSAFI